MTNIYHLPNELHLSKYYDFSYKADPPLAGLIRVHSLISCQAWLFIDIYEYYEYNILIDESLGSERVSSAKFQELL